MKKIILKTVKMDNNSDFEYRDELINILRVAPQGMDLVEMENALRCIAAVNQAKSDEVLLEDADHKFLSSRVDAHRWRFADTAIVQFIKDIKGAEPVTVEAKAETKADA